MKWFVRKVSRGGPGTKATPYHGPSWGYCPYTERDWFDTREEAERVANSLSAINPVGFVARECDEDGKEV